MVSLLKLNFPFNWNDLAIKYIGISLTSKFETLYTGNYPPMFRKLEHDLKTWSKPNFSWIGRINAVKMTMLPKLLYLFRFLPTLLRRDHLKSFQSKILKFIWGGSGYRLKTTDPLSLSLINRVGWAFHTYIDII